MTLREYLEKADADTILHIGAGNSFFFVGPKEEFDPENTDAFFKDEAKRRCENYVKYISRSLERVFNDSLEEKTKQSSHRRIKEHLQPILSNVTYLHDFTPVIEREVKEIYKRIQGDGIVVIVEGTEFGNTGTERNIQNIVRKENAYVNHEGYYDPTAGKAIENMERMPTKIYEIYKALSHVASLHGLEIIGLRDKYSGKEWRKQLKENWSENEKKKRYLMSYRWAKKQEERILEEIQALRMDKMFPSTVNDGMPKGSEQRDLSDYAVKLDELIQELKKERLEKVNRLSDIQKSIRDVENDDEQTVLRLRYIDGMPWEDICVKIGYSWRQTHRIHSNALENVKIKKGNKLKNERRMETN